MNRKQRRTEKKQAKSAMQDAPLGAQQSFAEALRHHQAGRLDEAERLYRQALAVDPRHSNALQMLGVVAFQAGRNDLAIDLIGKAIGINAKEASYHSNFGVVLMAQRKLDEAVACYRKALVIKPDYADAHHNLGIALQDQGRLDEAIQCYRTALALNPDYAEAHYNLGTAFAAQDKLDEAMVCFRQALILKPTYAKAHYNLSGIYELQNRLEDFEQSLETAELHCGGYNDEILFRRAQLFFRRKEFAKALNFLEKVRSNKISTITNYFNILGKTYEALGRFDDAFRAFEQQKQSTSVSIAAQTCNAETYFERIEQLRISWRSGPIPCWSGMSSTEDNLKLAFLIGFPRSGTTLLDSILRSHPNVTVVEEMPMVDRMKALLRNIETPELLNSLTKSQILALREAYLDELRKHLGDLDRDKLVIDKLPLNITSVGLIHRVFPNAKLILALRHPCDCVLSCFIQDFKLNNAMANFLSLSSSAKLYAATMELWRAYVDKLHLDFSTVRYESLIQDLKGTLAPVIQSLELEWHDNLLNYRHSARNRAWINTPSYSQVVEPLYQSAIGKWRNYTKQLSLVEPILRPWIDEFGYQ